MYGTVQNLVDRYGEREISQISTRPGGPPPGTPSSGAPVIDNERVEAALTDAFNLINGYLGKRYSLPLNPVPSLVVRWSCDLARWFLQPGAAPEMVKANYERCLAELREIAAGTMTLGESVTDSGLWSGKVESFSSRKDFSKKDLKVF
jgi:phage gp36-like protein